MSLPVHPDAENVLRSCAETLQKVVLPEVETDWGRYSASLCIASLEYAIGLLQGDRNTPNREELALAVEGLRSGLGDEAPSAMREALQADSPWEAASALLVASQNEGGELGEQVRAALHPVLYGQLDREMAAAMPLFIAFAKNMSENQ